MPWSLKARRDARSRPAPESAIHSKETWSCAFGCAINACGSWRNTAGAQGHCKDDHPSRSVAICASPYTAGNDGNECNERANKRTNGGLQDLHTCWWILIHIGTKGWCSENTCCSKNCNCCLHICWCSRLWLRCWLGFGLMKKRTALPLLHVPLGQKRQRTAALPPDLGSAFGFAWASFLASDPYLYLYPFGSAFGWFPPFPSFSPWSPAFGFGVAFGFALGFEDGVGKPLDAAGSSASCATTVFASDLGFAFGYKDARIDSSLASSRASTNTVLILFISQSHDRQWDVSLESLMRSIWRCSSLHLLALEYDQVKRVVSVGWCDCGTALSTYSMRSTNFSKSFGAKPSNCKSSKACWVRLLITTIQIKTNMLGQHEQKCSATGRSSSHLTRLRISLKPHPKFTFQMTGVHDGCCTPLGFLPLGLWLCCFWLSGSVASGVPVAFLSLSLLLCLGPSGGDRGPQAQKPPNLETTNPPAPISASLRAPLARNGAPIYRKSPSVALPWASSLALWLFGSAASGVPVAFLSFSPSLLGGTGARKPKSHTN